MTAQKKKKFDWFLPGMAVAVALAWLLPEPGARGGALHPELLNKLGVALIFFLHGVALPFAALKEGTLRWRLHMVVQSATYLLFPLLGLALLWVAGRWMSPELRLGFFFLCALPSTVSSSVAMTAAAKGNVPAAVFNATFSSLIGIALTPLWVGAMLHGAGGRVPMGPVVLDLVRWLLLPLALGQIARPWFGAFAERHRAGIHAIDRGTILLLIYTSFCDSVVEGVWTRHGAGPVVATLAGTVLLFFVVLAIMVAVCNALGFSHADRSAAVFCGSKKTLVSGVPMARLIFAGNPALSLILLPIMVYHPLQLVVCGALAGRWARETPTVPPA